MLAGAEPAAAQFPDAQEPLFPLADRDGGQLHNRVGHREFRGQRNLVCFVFADPQRRGRESGQPAGQLVQELPEFRVTVRENPQGFEAVDDDQPGAPLFQHRCDVIADTREAVAAGHQP